MQTQVCSMSWPEEWRATNTEMSYHSHVSARGELTLGFSWCEQLGWNEEVSVTNTVITLWTFLIRCSALTKLVTFFFYIDKSKHQVSLRLSLFDSCWCNQCILLSFELEF